MLGDLFMKIFYYFQAINAAQRKGLEIETTKKCNNLLYYLYEALI
jgi:hypothetical protein